MCFHKGWVKGKVRLRRQHIPHRSVSLRLGKGESAFADETHVRFHKGWVKGKVHLRRKHRCVFIRAG